MTGPDLSGPFAVLHRPGSTAPTTVDVLVGDIVTVGRLDEVPLSPGPAVSLCQRVSQAGAWLGTCLCQKPGRSLPLGKRCRLTGRPSR